jgi:GWxTD domain-containing protein
MYRYWLTEDALNIIAPQERCALLHLDSDKEWSDFIERFWHRRASDPISLENDFRKEHYRRFVFANERLSTDIPGWKTDRGHISVLYGPPDKIKSI